MMERYRCKNGVIEMQIEPGKWTRSAHDDATVDELPDYEGTTVLNALRDKFGAASHRPSTSPDASTPSAG